MGGIIDCFVSASVSMDENAGYLTCIISMPKSLLLLFHISRFHGKSNVQSFTRLTQNF